MIEKVFVKQGLNKVELDNYLAKELDKAGFTKSEIVKTPLVTRIVVNVTRPGLAIGKSGSNIAQLTETIGKKFGIDNPQIEIKEIEKQEIDAQAVANRFKALIERGFSWRSVVFRGLQDMQRAGAQGAEIIVGGKLSGKGGRKKSVRIAWGYMKKVGEQAKLVDYGHAAAYPKVGAIGIKVKIVKPGMIFPDKEKAQPYIEKRMAAEKTAAANSVAETKAIEPVPASEAISAEKPVVAAESKNEPVTPKEEKKEKAAHKEPRKHGGESNAHEHTGQGYSASDAKGNEQKSEEIAGGEAGKAEEGK
ncbi:MAG: 30S ribosomal protein S3 [Candidatus Diapherotrites archaeon]|uniref:30S ribosomal protein S3 n=1 Tax=Candidatus Iainarchaeum sp. TaxID=3101447 RepID=A0A8T3YM34_9ARCH|nr:30S ribosomal protein S3 [Candidatus Diapherotrites archaeon]